MNLRSNLFLVLFFLLNVSHPAQAGDGLVQHELTAALKPEQAWLEVTDTISLPDPVKRLTFELHSGLSIELTDPGTKLTLHSRYQGLVPISRYVLRFSQPQKHFTIKYQGQIEHPIQSRAQGYAGGRGATAGLISPEGVFLNMASYWFPVIDTDHLLQFILQVTLPQGWSSISQGEALTNADGWQESQPQDDIYLIAGPFIRYQKQTAAGEALVLLHQPNPALAERYLDATGQYLALYESLLGPYPYKKFALVENFWESGFGMPSFTLLGPRVIRLPFILHSSYPHEILHNWWGNGVFVDVQSGNWSEGLTSYLADHLIKEQRGQGAGYRRRTLQAYADYVSQTADFPLVQFRGNHGQASQAVGYGKTLMLFHMLRKQLGDATFLRGLRYFYEKNLFRSAGFSDLKAAFEQVSGDNLSAFFSQWTKRTGAPALELGQTQIEKFNNTYQLKIVLRQVQQAAEFKLNIPLFIQVEGEQQARPYKVLLDAREKQINITLDKKPLRITLDPRFETFRQLDSSEIPRSLGSLFGSEQLMIILPGSADEPFRKAYLALAKSWARQQPGLQITWDHELEQLPPDTSLWIIGKENSFAHWFSKLTQQAIYNPKHQSIALTQQHPANPTKTIGLVSADNSMAISGLARKLPHYGRYGYVTFTGNAPDNQHKGEWQLQTSALNRLLVNQTGIPPIMIPALKPLTGD